MARHPAGKGTIYRVKSGDSLWDIAAARVPQRDVPGCMRAIYSFNSEQIVDPDLIFPKQILEIPEDC